MAETRSSVAPAARPERPLVIGVGNDQRGDDAFGLVLARRLRARVPELAEVVELPLGGAELLEAWSGRAHVWVVDAIRAGGPPGTLYRLEIGDAALPTPLSLTSSHGVSLAQAVALGQVLHRLPGRLVIHGVEPDGFATGSDLSAPVRASIAPIAQRIEAEVRAALRRPGTSSPGGGPHA